MKVAQLGSSRTVRVYFTSRSGKVMSTGSDADRLEAQMYVNRNNAAARRRGDFSKPYAVLSYVIPTNGDGEQN